MPGHTPLTDPTLADAQDAARKLAILKAEVSKLKSTLSAYVENHGPLVVLNSDGDPLCYADNRQTVTQIPVPELLAESLCGLGADDVLTFMVTQKLTAAQLNWMLYKSPWKEHVQAELQIEEGEGLQEYYGAASIDTRMKPAGMNDRVVMPGEKPMKNVAVQEDE
jgi:hypothetical protein